MHRPSHSPHSKFNRPEGPIAQIERQRRNVLHTFSASNFPEIARIKCMFVTPGAMKLYKANVAQAKAYKVLGGTDIMLMWHALDCRKTWTRTALHIQTFLTYIKYTLFFLFAFV